MKFNLAHRRRYPWIFGCTCLVLLLLALFLPLLEDKRFEAVVASLGLVGAVTHFLYNQNLEETRLFRELFTEFNARYDGLNGKLNDIVETLKENPDGLEPEQKKTLYDYFNLCAEEYLYHRGNFLQPEVWTAWCRGMCAYADVAAIRDLWEEELATGSYYGFKLKVIDKERPKLREKS